MIGTTVTIPDVSSMGKTLGDSVQNLDWSAGSNDLIILLIFAVMILIHIFAMKKNKIFSLLFGIYVSYLVILFFPYNLWLASLSLDQMVWAKVGGFMALICIFMSIFTRGHVFAGSHSGIIARTLQSIVLGILNTGLILSLLSTLLPLSFLNSFSGLSLNILTSELGRFVWIGLPLVLFLFSVKFSRKGPGRPALE